MAEDGAMACAEAIERFSFEGRYANPVYLEHIAGIIRAYRDREVAEARELWQSAEKGIDGLRQRYQEQADRAHAAEARVDEQAGEIERLLAEIRQRGEYAWNAYKGPRLQRPTEGDGSYWEGKSDAYAEIENLLAALGAASGRAKEATGGKRCPVCGSTNVVLSDCRDCGFEGN